MLLSNADVLTQHIRSTTQARLNYAATHLLNYGPTTPFLTALRRFVVHRSVKLDSQHRYQDLSNFASHWLARVAETGRPSTEPAEHESRCAAVTQTVYDILALHTTRYLAHKELAFSHQAQFVAYPVSRTLEDTQLKRSDLEEMYERVTRKAYFLPASVEHTTSDESVCGDGLPKYTLTSLRTVKPRRRV